MHAVLRMVFSPVERQIEMSITVIKDTNDLNSNFLPKLKCVFLFSNISHQMMIELTQIVFRAKHIKQVHITNTKKNILNSQL